MNSANSSYESFGSDQESLTKPWPGVPRELQSHLEQKFFEPGVSIDFTRLKGLQWWAPYLLMSQTNYITKIVKQVSQESVRVNRPLTAKEVEALSEYSDGFVRKLSYLQLGSVSGAAWLTYTGRSTFKFPLIAPKASFVSTRFPTRNSTLITGNAAKSMWHLTRFAVYCPLVWFGLAFVVPSWAGGSYAAHIQLDPRLRDFVQDVKKSLQQQAVNQFSRANSNRPQTTSQQQQGSQGNEGYPAANESWEESKGYQESSYPQEPLSRPSYQPPPQYRQPRGPPPQQESQGAWEDSDPFDDDNDASPLSPAARQEARAAQSGASGSSWDRIREQNASRTNQSQQQQQQQSQQRQQCQSPIQQPSAWSKIRQEKSSSAGNADSYSYSEQDMQKEGRSYEKENAQKDFDDMVEAERRGKSGSSWWR